MTKAFYINYRDCFGCHSCETACQMYHNLPPEQGGIKITQIGPWQIVGETWEYDYLPFFTEQCDLCIKRTAEGKLPTCVQHCEGRCLAFGELEDMEALLEGHSKGIVQKVAG